MIVYVRIWVLYVHGSMSVLSCAGARLRVLRDLLTGLSPSYTIWLVYVGASPNPDSGERSRREGQGGLPR